MDKSKESVPVGADVEPAEHIKRQRRLRAEGKWPLTMPDAATREYIRQERSRILKERTRGKTQSNIHMLPRFNPVDPSRVLARSL